MYKISHLTNELTVASHQMSGAFSVSIGIWFRVGSRYESDALAGIAHLLEHMVFKGSKTYSADAIKRRIEGSGGQLNGFTSEELTCYLAKVPRKMAHQTFKILLDMALHPCLKPQDLAKEKTVIIEEIKMYNDQPSHIVEEQLDRALWPNHPLGRAIAGSTETVRSISKDALSQFKDDYYTLGNTVIVFAGNIKHAECLAFVRDAIKAKAAAHQAHAFQRFVSFQDEPMVVTRTKDTEQAKLAIGFTAYDRQHPKRFALFLLSIILGGNMSSRLFDKIREKRGLAYSIKCEYKPLIDTGAFYIFAGLDTRKIDLALGLTLVELHTLTARLVSFAELKRAQEFALGQLAMLLEDTLDHMIFVGESVASMGKVFDFNYIKKEVLKVTPEEIRRVAGDIFHKEKINISLVGPIKDFKPERCKEYIVEKLR